MICALCAHFDKVRRPSSGWVQSIRLAKGERGFPLCQAHMDMMVETAGTTTPLKSVLKR
jgi:hypothetical protein